MNISKDKLISCINSDLATTMEIYAKGFWLLLKKPNLCVPEDKILQMLI